jgi:rhomboid protease GluP
MWRQRTGSTLCASCGQLVGVADETCYNCGRRAPALFGFAPLLRRLGGDLGFVTLVMWSCGALFIASLAVDPRAVGLHGIFSMLSPSTEALFLFGASGALPVFGYGRWWTVLSAGWLHAGLLHIVFNMLWVRDLGPAVAHLFGASRTVLIYTASAVAGFTASTLAGAFLGFLPRFLRGGGFTVGASAAIFGLIGALLCYGRRGGSVLIAEHAKRWALGGLMFGFMIPGIDNWAHMGGLAGGYAAARWLDPLRPERLHHLLAALACLALSLASIVLSVLDTLSHLR